MTQTPKEKKGSVDSITKMYKAIAKYVKDMGGSAIILGGVSLQRTTSKTRYTLCVEIVGKRPTKKNLLHAPQRNNMTRCKTCSEELHVTPDGYEFGHLPPCEACKTCGARMKQKDNVRYCERFGDFPNPCKSKTQVIHEE